jgi:hypothetical protein
LRMVSAGKSGTLGIRFVISISYTSFGLRFGSYAL